MLAIETNTNSTSKVIELEKPQISSKEVLIQTIGCGLCGTDLLKINLKLLKQPTVLGHEIVGRVVEKGDAVSDFELGDFIVVAHHAPCFECHFCQHKSYSMCETFKKTNLDPGGFTEFVRISELHLKHTAFKVPKSMPWQEALFTEPLACCVRSVDQLSLCNNDTAIVIGLGSIGLMMTKLLKRFSCHIIGVDTDPARCENAIKYGVDEVFSNVDSAFVDSIKKASNNRGADGVVFSAGPATMLNESLSWIRNGGFINLFSHLAGEIGNIDTSELYHRELQIITSYSASPESLKKSFEILRDENLNLRMMFAEPYSLNDFEKAVNDMNERRVLKALIEF